MCVARGPAYEKPGGILVSNSVARLVLAHNPLQHVSLIFVINNATRRESIAAGFDIAAVMLGPS